MPRVLVLAYYFPPMGLSGVQRTAKFVKYLPQAGWQPTVLTVRPGGYYAFDEGLLDEVKRAGIAIERTRSLDPTRLFGRRRRVEMPGEATRRLSQMLSQLFFVPDNKIGWMLPALKRGSKLLGDERYDAIFSTAPPYTSHLIGAALSRRTDTPLLLDFRDDWLDTTHHSYPTPLHRRLQALLERRAMQQCRAAVTINSYIRDALAGRHPSLASRIAVIPHGYDAEDFGHKLPAGTRGNTRPARVDGVALQTRNTEDKLTFLYSGVFYDAQTPETFLRGAARALGDHPEMNERLQFTFVGHFPDRYKPMIMELALEDHVQLCGYRSHQETVGLLQRADILWMTVGRQKREEQVSTSKLLEYVGTQKPILGLVPAGAAGDTLSAYGAGIAVAPDDPVATAEAIIQLYQQWKENALPHPKQDFVRNHERAYLAEQLADHLTQIMNSHAA